MGANIETELKIPDLWYDFYARFLPGAAFITALRLIFFKNYHLPNVIELFLLLFAGYFCSLISQPLSSRLTILIENFAEHRKVLKKNQFVKMIQHKVGRESRDSMILSKMHAEVTFFVQLSVLSAVTLVLQIFQRPFGCLGIVINILCPIIFVIEAGEVSFRRLNRAMDLENYVNK